MNYGNGSRVQLSYARPRVFVTRKIKKGTRADAFELIGGDEGDRTPDLCNAIAALSQLSYVPK